MKVNQDNIDLAAIRNEIASANEQTAQWEKSLDFSPTAVARWTKMVEFAGPQLQRALRMGIVYIEIREKAAAPNGYDKPRFVIEGEPTSDAKTGR